VLPSLLAVSTADATLLAAIVAAAASLLNIVANAFAERSAAMRAAHRSILQTHLEPLGESIHTIAAGAVLEHRRAKTGQAPGNAQANAFSAAEALKEQRLLVKYCLNGLDEPLRIFTRAPNWIATYKGNPTGDEFVEGLQRLSGRLDSAIARSYRRGRPPSWIERSCLNRDAEKVRGIWEMRFGSEPEER
jgi:hypothetical protein